MKYLFTVLISLLSIILVAQSPGDTIVVETFNYSQTHGSGIRDTMIDFPDDSEMTYSKIIMLYNMRCKDGLISTTTDRNRGCGEWDYSCNTYITDSSRVDSVLSFTPSHYISAFSGPAFEYVESPLYNYYQYRQKAVQIDAVNSESLHAVGSDDLDLYETLATNIHSGKSQYLFTANELTDAGLAAGDIDAIEFYVNSANSQANYLKVRMKQTQKENLTASDPDLDGFDEVYFHDTELNNGTNRLQFHTPFVWDGTSNIIVEFTFTNHELSNETAVAGGQEGFTCGLITNNNFCLESVNGKIELPVEPMSSISDAITISFWSYGNENVQPVNNSIIYAVDGEGSRTANIHLPWGNSNIYWDCGNVGSAYDRINKSATEQEFKGSWSHWAFTKDTTSGEMKIYHNGELWHSGTDKKMLIDIQQLLVGTSGNIDRSYFGKIDELRIWDTELEEQTINDWMYTPINGTHPNYNNLVAYYRLDEGSGTTITDNSDNYETAMIDGYMYWVYQRGDQLNRDFYEFSGRPKLWFAQGDYNLTITDDIVTDSVQIIPNIVREYEIIPRYGTLLNDSIHEASVNEYWQAQYEHIYDPDGDLIDSVEIIPAGEIDIEELTYYNRYPSKYEIMSFVTPYGINLDLGMEGKTWAFDVTDYTPILKGPKRMTIERGGQWQEDMDIKFLFVVGTPPRDVLNINQLWRADSKGYSDIMADRAFEARDVPINADGAQFKIRSTITGHGQQGEFTPRHHFLNINGNEVFNWINWTECSTNPIFPQGGTWIYDRAGWCPGQASDLYEYDITDLVTAGETANIDYGLEYANGASNYIVNNQLVTYGEPNFNLDASVLQLIKPNTLDAKNDRFNPACDYPEIVIQNTGATTLTSLDIEYYEEGGESSTMSWNGSLDFLEVDTVILHIDDVSFWIPASNIFVVTVSNPNGQNDEYEYNNTYKTYFDGVDIFPEGEYINIVCKTNNYGWQTNYSLYNDAGTAYLEKDNLDDNTIYETSMLLPAGCYKLQINDKADDGLSWWHNSTQGTGYLRIKNNDDVTLYNFETEFGRFEIYEFGIGEITSIDHSEKSIGVAVYPNPATDRLNIQVTGDVKDKLKLRLLNAMGTVLLTETFSLAESELITSMDIASFPPGVYILQVENGTFISNKKIIKK
jgi:hypothetical protein